MAPFRFAPEPGFAGTIGVARRDITPPPGVPTRSWGPATHEFATGVHRPLTLTAIAFTSAGGQPLVLVASDLGWWKHPGDEAHTRQGVLDVVGGDPARALVNLSHTHSAPTASLADGNAVGAEYIATFRAVASEAAVEAISRAEPATLTTAVGRCSLAGDRDFPHEGRYVVGWNPDARGDDTVVVGRIAADDGRLLAILVNYACHPTTLAWQNTLVSPDFVGGMREVVEIATGGVPLAFLQGASGELAPRHQYVGDVSVADRHGRSLGYAAMSALEAMPPPGSALAFEGVVESGAALGMWEPARYAPPTATGAVTTEVELDLRPMATIEELERRWQGINPVSLAERLRRARALRSYFAGSQTFGLPVWVWRLGDCLVVGIAGEPYSKLQRELRARHPDRRVLVLGVTNAALSAYLPTREAYGRDVYQAWQTPYAPGSLERVIDACDRAIGGLLAPDSGP
jgi:hypothetical protein